MDGSNGSKININRILLAGLIGGFAMLIIELGVQGILVYLNHAYQQQHQLVTQGNPWISIHLMITVLSGIPLALIYAATLNYFGSGLKSALMIGILIGVINMSQASMTPIIEPAKDSLIGFNINFLKCVGGVLISAWIYTKDTYSKTA